ncbi:MULTISPECIES: hypothetical protein [unclassified Psychrobacillus]|uniref:hypothetical protein n=1 Tax=unclassified Psychrobacillus TaxID=2636677 RepID=UPI0012AFFFF6|nr:hypothetical protein GI482_05730 [Bacillus sp. N3536]
MVDFSALLYGILLIVIIGEILSILIEQLDKERTGFFVKLSIIVWIISFFFI